MLATWIESAAKGRLGGPVRAGMWSAAVIGTHPIQANQRAWIEVFADDSRLGLLPAYWIENKGANSFWHAPLPPQAVGTKLHYRAIVDRADGTSAQSAFQDTLVRPNLPDRTESNESLLGGAEALVGNRMMTIRVDGRGSTYDIYFPTVGLHSFVRPREGDQPQSRCHFRAIVGGLAVGRRLDWFSERAAWEPYQQYQGVTNLLTTRLSWRSGPIQVLIVDFAAMGECLPKNAGQEKSPGQYIKRFLIKNEGREPRAAVFAVYVQAEINGGVGDVGLSWHDLDRALLAINRGHSHSNRKLARDATIEFAIALDGRGEVECEPTGPNEALLFRSIELPAGETVALDLLVSGAFTGWSGDRGTFEHWLRPALTWFRSTDLDQVEHADRPRVGRFRRAGSRPVFSQTDLCCSSAPVGAGGGAPCRRRVGWNRLRLRSRLERLLLAARRDQAGRVARPRGPSRNRPGRLPVALPGARSIIAHFSTGSRNTQSTAFPSGKRRPSTRRRWCLGDWSATTGAPATKSWLRRYGR